MPPAPPTFSKTTVWPKSSERRDAKMRPMASAALPAANGYTMVTGRIGQSCAVAGVIAPTSTVKAAMILILGIGALRTCKLLMRWHPQWLSFGVSECLPADGMSAAAIHGTSARPARSSN